MDLPTETSGGEIPLDGYFVSSVWNGMGDVTDILVTRNKWLYIAEDSSTVKRYKGKGSNVMGTIIADAIESVEGLDRPVSLDEGVEDHIFILDMVDSTAVFYTDRTETSHFIVPAVIPVVKLFDMLPADDGDSAEGRTAADNATARSVFIIGPDKKIKATLTYPMSTGRNFAEILRLIDSCQLTAEMQLATPANWEQGGKVIISPSVSDEEARERFPDGWEQPLPYIRIVDQPSDD